MTSTGRNRRSRHPLVWIAAVPAAVLVIAAIAFYSSGGRWFVVETPSMATAAPVGTLVLTQPATDLAVGDVITFHPPTSPAQVYTHRIVAVSPDGISTRGDLNGAADPWLLSRADVVGRAVALLPVLGWAVRALPLLLLGVVVLWLVSASVASATTRASVRIAGVPLIVSAIVFVLKPLVAITVLATTVDEVEVSASVVSTGILPIRVHTSSGAHLDLTSGESGVLTVPAGIDDYYRILTDLNLPLLGWIAFAAVCALPLLWVLVVGLPARDDEAMA